jgi:ubiquinone/menaquinone biosynthesis C-methylase UbiE
MGGQYSAIFFKSMVFIFRIMDMFHRVDDPVPFLAEINRITKPGGRFIIEDGHQSRTKTLAKLSLSPRWTVERETARDVRLRSV